MKPEELQRTIVHRVTGESVTFVQTAHETGGRYLLIEVALPSQGDGPPLHVHDTFEEEFECVSGQLTVILGKKKVVLLPGEKARAEKWVPHTFTNDHDEPVVFRVTLTPPSRFEESIRIHYGLMDDGLTDNKGKPRSIFLTALILSLQDTWMAGIPVWLQRKVFSALVRRGYRKNAYRDLSGYTGKPV